MSLPGTGNTATFNNAGGASDTITTGNITIRTILFDTASAAAYTLGASPGIGKITLNDSGAITINSGVVNNQLINADVSFGESRSSASYSITNHSATSIFTLAGAIAGGLGGPAQGNKILNIAGAGNVVLSGIVKNGNNGSDPMDLIKSGTGRLTLSNANTYSGTTTIRGGSVVVGANAPSGANGTLGNATSAIVLGDGSTAAGDAPALLVNGAFTVARSISVGSLANTAAYNAIIGGSNSTGTSTYSGNITLNTTATNYTATLVAATGGTVDFSTGTWTTNNKAIAIGTSGNTGTVKLSNTLATTGGVSVNFGTLLLGSSNRLGDTTPITVAGGILDTGTALTDTVSVFNMSSGSLNGTGTITATTYGLSGGTVNGNLGTGTINSSGNVALNGTAGATAVNVTAGTLTLGSANRLADSAAISLSGGTLDIGGFNDSVGAVTLTNGSITGTTGVLTGTSYDVRNGSVFAIISGSGGLVKSTGGTVILSGANTYTGGTTITGGMLQLGSIGNGGSGPNTLGQSSNAASNLAFDGGTLSYTGGNGSTNRNFSITGGKSATINVVTGSSTLTISGASSSSTGSLIKTGAGTLELTGINQHTGDTVVKAGTLKLSGSGSLASTNIIVGDAESSNAVLDVSANGLIVVTGKTVSGIGTIIGNTTLQSGSYLAPGNSPGILNTGDIDLANGSTLQIEIFGANLSTDYDQLSVSGSVTLAGLLAVDLGTFDPTSNSMFFILNNDDAGSYTGRFSNALVDGGIYNFGGQDFQISYFGNHTGGGNGTFTGGNDIVLMAVPEPSAALLGGLGMSFLLRRRRN